MHHLPPALLQLLSRLAAFEACVTSATAASVLACPPEQARDLLRAASSSGLLRPRLLPGLGNQIVFQPTPRAAGLRGGSTPKFLRAGLDAQAAQRGLIRAAILFAHPNIAFIPAFEQDAFCHDNAIPARGHPRALIAREGAENFEIFVPVLVTQEPAGTIAAAVSRWFPLLETGSRLVIACFPEAAVPLRDALAQLLPAAFTHTEQARLEAEIARDKTGTAAIRLAGQRAKLAQEATEGLSITVTVERV